MFPHQPSAASIRGGCAPNVSDLSGATPGPAPGPCRRCMASPGPGRELSCTAAEYSNEADQHCPRTTFSGQRRAETTSIDRLARSSHPRGHQIDDGLPKPAGTQSVTTAATPHSNWMSRCSYDVVGTRPVGTCHSYRRPLLVMRRPSLNTTRPSSPASLAAIGTASPAVP